MKTSHDTTVVGSGAGSPDQHRGFVGPHSGASDQPNAPRFYGENALAGWKRVLDEVHAAREKIMSQLMHRGRRKSVREIEEHGVSYASTEGRLADII